MKKEMALEEMFEQLDHTIEMLNDREISLEKSFEIYQNGMKLLKSCNEKIDLVEKQVMEMDQEGRLHEF